jgi:alpha-N-arabinofuranosidase
MVLSNLVHNTRNCGIFTEVDHGPAVIANNIFLAPTSSICHNSAGNAYAHNLLNSAVGNQGPDSRLTPVLVPHETDFAAVVRAVNGDHRMYNNLLVSPSSGFAPLNPDYLPCFGAGNVYTGGKGTAPSKFETSPLVLPAFQAGVSLSQGPGGAWFLALSTDPAWATTPQPRQLVDTALLGNASAPAQPYTLPDGSPYAVTVDYFGRPRNASAPFPGPFEVSGAGMNLQVWPRVPPA